MAGITDVYPADLPDVAALVRGDPFTIPVTFSDETDLTGWTFRCQIRAYPDDPNVIASAAITVAGNVVSLAFTDAQAALLNGGEGLDLEQLTPTHQTLWIVRSLRVEKDYSRD